MDPQIAYIVKEDILRNVIKIHKNIMIAGWNGVGKTVTSLKAAEGLFDIYYYNESDKNAKQYIAGYSGSATVLSSIKEFDSIKSERPLLIIDDLGKISGGALDAIAGIMSDKSKNRKIILITQVLVKVKDFFPDIDVVVRFKKDTAEVLMTNLCDMDNI